MTSTFGVRDIFVEANGLRHHLIARGSPGTPIAVMLHNLVGQARMFDAPAAALADSQHVYALDFRGRGESAWGPPDDYNQATYAADLEAVRDALGLQRFALIGTALGGGVAMAYAAAHPERVSALVMNDIGPDLESAGVSRISTRTESTPTAFPDMKAVVAYYKEHFPAAARLPDERISDFARWNVRLSDTGLYVWKMDPAGSPRRRGRAGKRGAVAHVPLDPVPGPDPARRAQRHPQPRNRRGDEGCARRRGPGRGARRGPPAPPDGARVGCGPDGVPSLLLSGLP